MKTLNVKLPHTVLDLASAGRCVQIIPNNDQILEAQKIYEEKKEEMETGINYLFKIDSSSYVRFRDSRSSFWELLQGGK